MSTFLSVWVDGTDISAYVDPDTAYGADALTQQLDECSFTVVDEAAALDIEVKFDVLVKDQSNVVWFGGRVGQVQRQSEGPVRRWSISAQGYGCLLDGRVVNEKYAKRTDADIVADLLRIYRPDVTLGAVASPKLVDTAAFPYKTLREALDNLCRLTGAHYYVDGNKQLTYFQQADVTAAMTLSDTPSPPTSYGYERFTLTGDGTQVQNRITVIGGNYESQPTTESFLGDGKQTAFTLSQSVRSVQLITIDGWEQNYGYNGRDGFGGEFYITVLVDTGTGVLYLMTALGAGSTLEVTYTYNAPVLVVAADEGSHSHYGDYFDGRVTDASIGSSLAAQQRAQTALAQYAYETFSGACRIRAPRLRSGQGVHVHNTTDAVDYTYLVQSSAWSVAGNGLIYQDIQFIG